MPHLYPLYLCILTASLTTLAHLRLIPPLLYPISLTMHILIKSLPQFAIILLFTTAYTGVLYF
jgi:hypothetical protein